LLSVAVIGQGFVGGSLTTVLSERGVNVYTYDKTGKNAEGGIKIFEQKDLTVTPKNLEEFIECCESIGNFSNIYFLCLPTPMKKDGSCDISIVESVLQNLAACNIKGSTRLVVIKSTVPPGTTRGLNKKYEKLNVEVVFSPEFLTEANAIDDMRNQDRIILGGNQSSIEKISSLFSIAFPGVPLYSTTSTNAEMTKYVANCFLATKVSFANEIYQICEAMSNEGFDVEYNEVIKHAILDSRLGTSHWSVPGPMLADDGSNKRLKGFSGSCFPKDINCLIKHAKDFGVDPKVLKSAWEKNLEVRPERDWEKLKGRAISNTDD
jgi:nucleotide sugar dehydrogenase